MSDTRCPIESGTFLTWQRSVPDVPVQLGQWPCDGLAPGAHRRKFKGTLRFSVKLTESVSRQGFATRGAGAICLEATSPVPEGRISPQDAVRLTNRSPAYVGSDFMMYRDSGQTARSPRSSASSSLLMHTEL